MDTGKIIKQVRVPRLADDTIDSFEARIHEAEYKLYPEVINIFLFINPPDFYIACRINNVFL